MHRGGHGEAYAFLLGVDQLLQFHQLALHHPWYRRHAGGSVLRSLGCSGRPDSCLPKWVHIFPWPSHQGPATFLLFLG